MNAAASANSMTAFHPTTITLHPPPDPDPLAVALATALRRDLSLRFSLGLPIVLVLGLATAGLAPLVLLLLRFRSFATTERFQLQHLNEWMQESGRAPHELATATQRLDRRWPSALGVGLVLAMLAIGVAVLQLAVLRRSVWEIGFFYPFTRPGAAATAYHMLVVAGFMSHLLAVGAHEQNVARFRQTLLETDPIETSAMLPADRWTVAGTVLMIGTCIWGLPMMLAARAHNRYMKDLSNDVRARLAQRIDEQRGPDAHAT